MALVSDKNNENQIPNEEEAKIQLHMRVNENEYPIVWYEPEIDLEEKKPLKMQIQENSFINFFSEFQNAFQFAQALGTSFLLITSNKVDEEKLFQDFGVLKDIYGRRYFDFEEEVVLMSLLKGISDEIKKSLKIYVFFTRQDFENEAPANEEEEEVMVMCDVKEMAKQFQEEFTVIWCDPDCNIESKEVLFKEFDIHEKNIYRNFENLLRNLEDYNGIPYHLILSGKTKAEIMIDSIDDFKDLLCLYIYDTPLVVNGKKSRKVKTEKCLAELIPRIIEGIRITTKIKNALPAFVSLFNDYDKSHINKMHYSLRGFTNFKNRKQAKEDFIKLCKKIYQSKKLLNFEREYFEYHKNQILKWYAEESPIYKVLNNCLRMSTSDSILHCRFALRDMERAIKEEYQEQSKKYSGVVYRGTYISPDGFENLARNTGKEIEMLGFFSTTKNQKVAHKFLEGDIQNKVLIKIIIPSLPLSELNEQGFAELAPYTEFNLEEQEILFNVKSRFQILKAGYSYFSPQSTECRYLVLLYGAQLLRKYLTIEKPVISLKLEEPLEFKCLSCESKNNLFVYERTKPIGVICRDCFIKHRPDSPNTFLLPIDEKVKFGQEKIVNIHIQGKLLELDREAKSILEDSFRCHQCETYGQKRLYKWINLENQNIILECLRCFGESKEIRLGYLLLSEGEDSMFWNQPLEKWEKADLEFKSKKLQEFDDCYGADVYSRIQDDWRCHKFCRRSLQKFASKKNKEQFKITNYAHLGESSKRLGDYQKALRFHSKALDVTKFIYGESHLKTAISYNNLASVHHSLGNYKKTLEYYSKALDITKSISGETHLETAVSYKNLALVNQSLGNYQKALEYNLEAMDITKLVYGETHPDVAALYNNLALVYEGLGKYQYALEYQLKALDLTETFYGSTHPNTAASYNNLAMVYNRQRHHEKALEYHKKALDIRKSIYGENHPDSADSYNNIGVVSHDLGEYQKALECHLRSCGIRKSIYGECHPEVAASFSGISKIYNTLGEFQKALEYSFKALDILKSVYSETHPSIAVLYTNVAIVCGSLGENQKALEYYLRGLKIRISVYGEMHPYVAASYNDLALVYTNFKQHQIALEYCMKGLKITQSLFGESHPDIATSYKSLARIYNSMGQHRKALEYSLNALDLRKSIFGELNSQVATSYSDLALVYSRIKENLKALDYHSKAIEIRKSIFGESHPDTATSYSHLAMVYSRLKENHKALEYYLRALGIREAIFGEWHPDTVTSYSNLGMIYSRLKENEKALEYYLKGLELTKVRNGETHPNTATLYNNVATVSRNMGQHQKALEYYKKALDIRKSIYGEVHPEVAASYSSLAKINNILKQHQEALRYSLKALDIRKSLHSNTQSEFDPSLKPQEVVIPKQETLNPGTISTRENYSNASHLKIGDQTTLKHLEEGNIRLKDIKDDFDKLRSYNQDKVTETDSTCDRSDSSLILDETETAQMFQNEHSDLQKFNFTGKHLEALALFNNPRDVKSLEVNTKLAFECENSGDYDKAREYHQKALDLLISIHGEEHTEVSTCYSSLAMVYDSLGEQQKAREHLEKAIGIRESINVENDSTLSNYYNNLGLILEDLIENEEALKCHKKALNIRMSAYGENHPKTAASYHNLAILSESLDKNQEALTYHQEALKIRKSIYGENHLDIADSYNSLAVVYQNLENYQEALQCQEKAVQIIRFCNQESDLPIGTMYLDSIAKSEALGENPSSIGFLMQPILTNK